MAADYRTRILDAAEALLMEQPMSAPLHARVAERAGVSRPTVYKYVGDQEAIFRAVMERDALRYLVAIEPELSRPMQLLDHFAYLSAFSVQFFRGSPLLRAVTRNDPGRFLQWLTESFPLVVRDGAGPLAPLLRERMPSTRDLPVPLEELLEWGVRITLSLVLMPSAQRDLQSTDQLQDYVRGFLASFAGSATSVSRSPSSS